jgi:hypothetical protein
MRVVTVGDDEQLLEVIRVQDSPQPGYLMLHVDEVTVEISTLEVPMLVASLVDWLARSADRAETELARWVGSG